MASHGGQRDQEICYRGQKEICYRNATDREAYLVLQLDDADSQIDHSYQVLEDVRKYLVVPKMVILMSADVSIFRQLVLEKYAEEFPALGSKEEERQPLWADLRRMGSKYLDKLIPSIQLVTLPLLDQLVVQQGNNLELRYLEIKAGGQKRIKTTRVCVSLVSKCRIGPSGFPLDSHLSEDRHHLCHPYGLREQHYPHYHAGDYALTVPLIHYGKYPQPSKRWGAYARELEKTCGAPASHCGGEPLPV